MGGEEDKVIMESENKGENIPLQPINQASAAEEDLDSNHDKRLLGKSATCDMLHN